ncbi:hypothetical protein [Hymenobacter tenuis]
MKLRFLSAALLLCLSASCREEADEIVEPEYADWYAFRAPDARAIEAVTGDLDGTLIITTGFHVYQTKDRGKTWQSASLPSSPGIFGFAQQQDTLLALTATIGTAFDSTTAYAANPSLFSLDEGRTWKPYRSWQRNVEPRIPRNRVTTASGTEYSLEIVLTPISPQTSSSYVETVGIKTSTGRRLSVPQAHQLTSLYLDAKSRLYVTASAPLCGRRENFAFCGEQNGVLYISKQPQP